MSYDKKLLISTLEDDYRICFFDVSLRDINKRPIFTTKGSFNANFLHGSSCLHLRSCDKFLLMDNYDLQTAVSDPKRKMVKLLSGTAIVLPPPLKRGFTVSAKINCTGFGKDGETGDFRVIRNVMIWHSDCNGHYAGNKSRFEIFSMRTGKWKELEDTSTLPACALLNAFGSVLIDDVYYWIATDLPVPGSWGIVGFDFTTETFMFWGLSSKVDKKDCLYLIKLEDETLGLISYTNPCHPVLKFIIWAVQKGGGETGFAERHSFTLPQQHVKSPVGFIGGLLFLEEKLTETPTSPQYRLNVFNVSKRTLMPLEFYSHGKNMQVMSYEVEVEVNVGKCGYREQIR